MLKELAQQIEDIHTGSTQDLPAGYGHAIGMIAQVGQDEARCGEGTEEAQIKRMKNKATEEVIKFGVKILDYLRPELRALIQPEDLEQLEQDHQQYLSLRGK
ncbi:hypothetical protein HYU90_00220 [Candidatus Collierbacteria bacterium]|nr:hypothetical protein [Candidatus Collierbacteria bacterium]